MHGELVQEAKEETVGRFGGRWWLFEGGGNEDMATF